MIIPEHQEFEQILRRIAPGGRLRRVWPLSGGISAGMTAIEFNDARGQVSKAIVRRPGAGALRHNPHAARDEFRLLQIAQALGVAAPAPLDLDESGAIFPEPYLVVEYIEGAPSFAPNPPAASLAQLAAQLAALHRADYSRHDLSFLRGQPKSFAEMFGEPAPVGDQLGGEDRIRAALAPAWPPPQPNRLALLHGDYWPGNILWRGGRLVAVVDWEDARLGDPLSDLAIARLDLAWIYAPDIMQSFTEQYRALLPIDDTLLAYWDLHAALRLARMAGPDLAGWAAFFRPYGRHDITEQSIREHYRWFVAQAFERLATSK